MPEHATDRELLVVDLDEIGGVGVDLVDRDDAIL